VNPFHGDQGMFGIALGLACPRRRAWPTSSRTWALMQAQLVRWALRSKGDGI
jgi:hypothetical protein